MIAAHSILSWRATRSEITTRRQIAIAPEPKVRGIKIASCAQFHWPAIQAGIKATICRPSRASELGLASIARDGESARTKCIHTACAL